MKHKSEMMHLARTARDCAALAGIPDGITALQSAAPNWKQYRRLIS